MANSARARSARALGLRTLQHQTLPAAICYAIETEVWFRGLVSEQAGRPVRAPRRWATKDQVHDEAIAWFLARYANQPVPVASARRDGATADEAQRTGRQRRAAQCGARRGVQGSGTQADLTFWVDSGLLARARALATRNGMKLARLIEAALSDYVKEHVPQTLLTFRRQAQQQATRLYRAQRRAARPRP